jgi:hypothetical protein
MERLAKIAASRIWEVGAVVVAGLALVRLAGVLPGAAYNFDFNHYYAGSRMWWEGINPYVTDLTAMCARYGLAAPGLVTHASNPPAFVVCFVPLTWLAPVPAFGVWTFLQVLSLGVVLVLTRPWLPGRAWRLFCLAVIAATPVLMHFAAGQMQLLLAALVVGASALHRQGRHLPACLLVALAGLWKIFPLVLLPWFVWRAGENRIRFAAVTGAFLIFGVVVTGPTRWLEFANTGLAVVERCALKKSPHLEARNQTAVSWVIDLGYAAFDFTPAPATERWIQRTGLLAGLLVLAAGYVVALRGGRDEDVEIGLLTAVMVAGIPVAWSHYYVLLIFPLAILVARVRARPTLARVAGLSGLGILFVDPGVNFQGMWGSRQGYAGILATYIMLYGVLALAVWLAREKRV